MLHALLIFAAVQGAVVEEPDEPPYVTQTFQVWWQRGDVELVRQVKTGTYSLDLWVHRGEFNPAPYLTASKVDPETFYRDLLSVFDWAIPLCQRGLRQQGQPLTVVLLDKEPQNTMSAALRGTSVILCEVSRWHKSFTSTEPSWRELVYVSAAHELFHTFNYVTDPGEVRYMRELSAMIWESVALIHRHNADRSALTPELNRTQDFIRTSQIDVEADFLTDYKAAPVRVLAYRMAIRAIEEKGLAGLEELARRLLNDPRNGRYSLDLTLQESGFTFTSADVLADFRAQMKKPQVKAAPQEKGTGHFALPRELDRALSSLHRSVFSLGTRIGFGFSQMLSAIRAAATPRPVSKPAPKTFEKKGSGARNSTPQSLKQSHGSLFAPSLKSWPLIRQPE